MSNQQKLFLLKRTISPYSGEDLFLGVYDNLALANKQKERYLKRCKTQDRWNEQAYKTVDLETDVELIEIQDKQSDETFPTEGQRVYLVSGIFEGLGQISKTLVFVSINKAKVENFLEEKDEEDPNEAVEFADYQAEELKLNALFFPYY